MEIHPNALRVETEAGPVTLYLSPQTERWEGLFVADIRLEVGDQCTRLHGPDGDPPKPHIIQNETTCFHPPLHPDGPVLLNFLPSSSDSHR
ncbi:hypothetical protein [Thermoflexus hugenholtzii]